MSFSVIIGVIISLTGNALISVSLILQKLAHNMIKKERDGDGRFAVHHVIGSGSSSVDEIQRWEQEDGEIRPKRPFWKRPIWWLGFVTMFLGEAGNIFAYGFAPASIIAPLGTISLVLNAIIAPFYLKEKFGIKDTIGILLATTGTFLIVFFTAEYGASQTVRSMEDITALFTRLGVLIYFFCSVPIIIALTVASKRFGGRFVMIDILLISLYGSYTIVSIKAITEIVKCSFSALWTHLISYVMLFIFVATAALQLR
jgi:drug/metabolite transporter (DMT)-like permease